MDEADHLGFVERQRRSSGIEEVSEDEPTYTLYSLGGAPCIMAKVDAIFNLEYRTLRHGTQNVKASKGYLFSESPFYLAVKKFLPPHLLISLQRFPILTRNLMAIFLTVILSYKTFF